MTSKTRCVQREGKGQSFWAKKENPLPGRESSRYEEKGREEVGAEKRKRPDSLPDENLGGGGFNLLKIEEKNLDSGRKKRSALVGQEKRLTESGSTNVV